MKRKVARLKLSPNEEAQLIKQEHERRRKLRLQQVREQERYIALQIRREVQQRRDLELQNLAEELRAAWLRQRAERVRALESLYQHSLRAVGEGHRRAKENEPDLAAIAQKMLQSNEKAEERHRQALKELKTQRQKQSEEQTRHLKARRKALLAEKERSAKIASLPPPPPDPFENIDVKKLPSVKMYDVDSFSVTHYHLPETCVDREAVTEQADARAAAAVEGRRLEELEKEEEQERREQLEKARLRGSHALRVVQLTQDRERLLKELEQMQQADLARRRQVVAQMPPQLFEPAHKRQELKEERQRDLEFAFEDMYSGERRVKGDLVLRLVPEPLPVPSTGSHDGELDVTLESGVTSNGEEHSEESQSVHLPRRTEDQAQASKQALKRLLSKVRTQRDQWSSRSEAETAPETMTIESGSLDSEERDEEISSCPRDGPHHAKPPALASQPEGESYLRCGKCPETSEESIIAGSTTLLHPREQANKLRSASEKKKQEEELEVQKQEQVALLQHLEEQKMILEAHLQQALADRERLQAAILENPEGNEQPPSQKEEPSAATEKNNVLLSSSSEDEHVRKIRQYQQRLLEQNRLHKQSVEEARRCLQDYQLMLKKRYPSFSTTVVNSSTDVSAPQQPISFQQGGLHNGHLDSGLPLPEATVDQYLEPKQPAQSTFIVNPKTKGNLPTGSFPLGTHNGSLLTQSQSSSSKWCHYETSDTDNKLQTCIPSTFPITSVLGSDPSGAHAPAQNSDGDSQIPLPAQHSGREFYQDLLNAKTHPVHETFQGTFEMQRSEVDVGQLLKVNKNFHGIALQKGQLSSVVPLETSNPETQRTPLQDEAHIADKDVSTSSLVATTPVQSQGRLLVSSAEILAQKHQLQETREKLARQREALLQQQRLQEELLMQKQNKLKEQMSRQPTSLEAFHTDKLETDFGRGIMEEPELTLMSLNETTLQEEELTSNNMEETTGDKSEKPYLSKSPELENITKLHTKFMMQTFPVKAPQQSVFTRPNTRGKAATIASFHVSHVLAEHKKSCSDGGLRSVCISFGRGVFSSVPNCIISALTGREAWRFSLCGQRGRHPHHRHLIAAPSREEPLLLSGEKEQAMRQLKGKPKKETSKDKKERKQAMQEARQQIATVVLPTLAVVVLLIVVFVYVATRPGAVE
ncbi:CE295 protein, partial [Atractosteus spatula]|nr:CE295 protein [Atractosteus spatula]